MLKYSSCVAPGLIFCLIFLTLLSFRKEIKLFYEITRLFGRLSHSLTF
jgi:hypothetical protein